MHCYDNLIIWNYTVSKKLFEPCISWDSACYSRSTAICVHHPIWITWNLELLWYQENWKFCVIFRSDPFIKNPEKSLKSLHRKGGQTILMFYNDFLIVLWCIFWKIFVYLTFLFTTFCPSLRLHGVQYHCKFCYKMYGLPRGMVNAYDVWLMISYVFQNPWCGYTNPDTPA